MSSTRGSDKSMSSTKKGIESTPSRDQKSSTSQRPSTNQKSSKNQESIKNQTSNDSSKSRSNSQIIKQGWGNRVNFQASYGLKMTPEDIEEGNAILDAMRGNE